MGDLTQSGGYVAPWLSWTDMGGESGTFMGGRIGRTYNGNLTLGLYGGTRLDGGRKNFSHGGGFVEFDTSPGRLWHFSFGTLLGLGDAGGEMFLLIEPEGWLLVNFTRRTQLGVGAGARAVNGLGSSEEGGINGFGAGVIFKMGSF